MIYLSHKRSVVYVVKDGFFSKIMLQSTMHQYQRSTCLNKKEDFLATQRALQTSIVEKICRDWLLQKFMKEVDSTWHFLNSKTQS